MRSHDLNYGLGGVGHSRVTNGAVRRTLSSARAICVVDNSDLARTVCIRREASIPFIAQQTTVSAGSRLLQSIALRTIWRTNNGSLVLLQLPRAGNAGSRRATALRFAEFVLSAAAR